MELYRQLPYMGELDELLPLLSKGASVLELGCGTGRLAARLADAEFRVTGVDESEHMLAMLPPSVNAIQSTIESLELGRQFDAVLLASHLINHPSQASRHAFLACARRHLRPDGMLFLQRLDPEWLRTSQPGLAGRAGPIEIHVETVAHEDGLVYMTLRYERGEQQWRQSFSAVPLSEAGIEHELVAAQFAEFSWRGQARLWVTAIAR